MTDKFINLLKNYGSDSLQSLDSIYSDDVQYEDPINKGKDLDHLKLILEDFYDPRKKYCILPILYKNKRGLTTSIVVVLTRTTRLEIDKVD